MLLLSAAFLFSSFLQMAESEDCQEKRDLQRNLSDPTARGYYEVQCDEEDETKYKRLQCWPSTGACWCVDKYGNTITDSHSYPGETAVNCDTFGWCISTVMLLMKVSFRNNDTIPPKGVYIPTCDDKGNFKKTQQWEGESWCVVENGNTVPGTLTGPTDTSWDCENLPACLAKEASLAHLQTDNISPFGLDSSLPFFPVITGGRPRLDRPECDKEGNYKPTQCHVSTGYCWCVNTGTGSELEDTRRGPEDEGGYVDCAQSEDNSPFDPATATPCQKLYNVQRNYSTNLEHRLLGFWTVSCLKDGTFNPSQCHSGTGNCWCVDKDGNEVLGSRSLPDATMRMPCVNKLPKCTERKAMMEKDNLIGIFNPECEGDGSYKNKQCWDITGECWCVTKETGTEIAYTRRGPTKEYAPMEMDCDSVVLLSELVRFCRATLRDASTEDGSESGGSNTPLIVVIAILACLLVVVVVGGLGVVFFKRTNRCSAQYNTKDNKKPNDVIKNPLTNCKEALEQYN